MTINRLKALLQITAAKLDEKEDDDFILSQFRFVTQLMLTENTCDDTTDHHHLLSIKCLVNLCSSNHRNDLLAQILDTSDKLSSFVGLLKFSLFHTDSNEFLLSLIGLLCNLTRDNSWTNHLCSKNHQLLIDKLFAPDILQIDHSLPLLLNLTTNANVRQYLCETESYLSWFTGSLANEKDSNRAILLVGVIKNLCFDDDSHKPLLKPKTKLLESLLTPLCGPEDEVDDEDRQTLPKALQTLVGNSSTTRSQSVILKSTICHALLQLCATTCGRTGLRQSGTYFVLRELHKYESRQRKLLLGADQDVVTVINGLLFDIEQVVDQLICEEQERDKTSVETSLRNIKVDPKTSSLLEQSKLDFISTS